MGPFLAFVVALVAVAQPALATSSRSIERYLVRFAPSAASADRDAALRSVGGTVDGEIAPLGVTLVSLPAGADPTRLAGDTAVSALERDAPVHVAFTPNDPYYLTDPYTGLGQWGLRAASVDKAWDQVRGSPQVTVAAIDTGVDPNHPDLDGALVPGPTFLSAPSAGCGSGPNDDNSHGTHVAGIIGANGNNATGIAGVAFGVKVMPIKALDCTGSGVLSDIAQAIVYAADHGARIVNISLGATEDSPTLRSAVQYATARNVLVVAAAGNCGAGGRACAAVNAPSYPGAYPEVLAVAATRPDDTIAPFSTQGAYVGIAAPGDRIVSTTPTYPTYFSARGGTQSYGVFTGTSQASPFVAGVAALALSADPTLTAAALNARLRSTADDLGAPGVDVAFGAGRVNALRLALATGGTYGASYDTSAVPRSAAAAATFTASVRVTNSSSFTWTSTGTAPVRLAYHWVDAAGAAVVWDGVRTNLGPDLAPGASATLAATVAAPAAKGAYTLRFDLVREGIAWFSAKGVRPADVAATVGSGFAASYAPSATTQSVATGTESSLSVALTNTGTRAWTAAGPNPVRLSYHWLARDGTVVVWDGTRATFTADVPPGVSVTVSLPIAPPASAGLYTLQLDLVQEGIAWFSQQDVPPRDLPYTVTSGFAATYTLGAFPALLPGGRALVALTVRDDGAATWSASGAAPVRLASHLTDAGGNVITWDGERTIFAADVAPATSVTTNVAVNAPLAAGSYRVRVDLVREGVAWFSQTGVPSADATLNVLDDYRALLPAGPLAVSRFAPAATITVANTSMVTWTTGGAAPVSFATHWLDAQGHVLVWDGPRTALPKAIAPGQVLTFTVALGAPPAGATQVVIDLVADGIRWFGVGAARPVLITP